METATTLDVIEARVLGCLVEKEMATPDYYPLSLNALTNACNQKSNRNPVMALEEADAARALERLRAVGLAVAAASGGRVPKYGHNLRGKLMLDEDELALLCMLLLRGPQTVGELRGRTERMHPFAELAEVEAALQVLADKEPPLAVKLPRQPGRKENRFAHLLCGEPETESEGNAPPAEAATLRVRAENERIAALEEEVAALREELEGLKTAMAEFKSQFE
ncbi:MAG: DUF480 domain-containing protein [Desulfuromonas sp.]|uniref:YceH family protein n=1 Tax=Desulfuromonas sp. TaxID=892 RepID=UPI000CC0C84F|nr:YceH family protein [Desulfuromonas sp.]PLX82341.1 MAG: DUF480 domain-containing protein [Desulfuromonas sp.]